MLIKIKTIPSSWRNPYFLYRNAWTHNHCWEKLSTIMYFDSTCIHENHVTILYKLVISDVMYCVGSGTTSNNRRICKILGSTHSAMIVHGCPQLRFTGIWFRDLQRKYIDIKYKKEDGESYLHGFLNCIWSNNACFSHQFLLSFWFIYS